MMGLADGSHPITGTAFPGGKTRKKGSVHGPAALGVALHACVHASHPLCPQTLPRSPTVHVPPQNKMRLLFSSPDPEASAPHQTRGLEGLILHSRDRVGSVIALATLWGFPWGKVRAMLRAKTHAEVNWASAAVFLQPSQPLSWVKPSETHLSSGLVATQTPSIGSSGME